MTAIAHAHMALGNYEEALKAAERSLAVNPDFDPTYWMLIAANAQLGRMDEARRWLAKFRTLAPGRHDRPHQGGAAGQGSDRAWRRSSRACGSPDWKRASHCADKTPVVEV